MASGAGGHYDKTLLSDAPVVTKQMRQEGYNPDILQARNGALLNENKPANLSHEHLTSSAAGGAPNDNLSLSRKPFWRTTKGIVMITILVLIIIGAVIGGAVGGTQAHRNKDKNESAGRNSTVSIPGGIAPTSTTATNTSTTSDGQEIGQQTDTTTGASTTGSNAAGTNTQASSSSSPSGQPLEIGGGPGAAAAAGAILQHQR